MNAATDFKEIPHNCKILLSTAERVGDALFCTPSIRFLKKHRPDLKLDILAFGPGAAEVFQHNPDVNTIHMSASKRQICKLAKQYPLVLNLMYEFKKYLPSLSTPLISIGKPDFTKHRGDQALEFIADLLGEKVDESDRQYQFYPQAENVTKVEGFLRKHHVDGNSILIGCHLGCFRVARRGWKFWRRDRHQHKKVWPLENYVELAKRLKQLHPNLQFIITGSASEKFLAKPFLSEVSWVIDMIGETSLFEVGALMDKLSLYITHDTGTLHIACARNTPLVALFGPTKLEFTGPYPLTKQHKILRKENMVEITVDEVVQAVLSHL